MRGTTRAFGRTWAVALLAALLALPLGAEEITRVSVDDSGGQCNGLSRNLSMSRNGRYVCFHSDATDLVADDTNGVRDIFVRDRRKGRTTRVSVSSTGEQADGYCESGDLSANGRYVVFFSDATNLVPGDTNGVQDLFLRDRKKGRTTRISLGPSGDQVDGNCVRPVISANGRSVAYRSGATNIVPGDTNDQGDTFVLDRRRGVTTRVSVSTSGAQADLNCARHSMSANGRYVLMLTAASTLVPDDTNGLTDVFLHDRRKGTTKRVSVGPGGVEGDGDSTDARCSRTGRFVAFVSRATNLAPGDTNDAQDVFLYDVKKGTLERLPIAGPGAQADGDCFNARPSPDGRYVVFDSLASNLVPDDTNGARDLFLYDRKKRTTTRLSLNADGEEADGDSLRGQLTNRAKLVLFFSGATNLVAGDTNEVSDVFLLDRRH